MSPVIGLRSRSHTFLLLPHDILLERPGFPLLFESLKHPVNRIANRKAIRNFFIRTSARNVTADRQFATAAVAVNSAINEKSLKILFDPGGESFDRFKIGRAHV